MLGCFPSLSSDFEIKMSLLSRHSTGDLIARMNDSLRNPKYRFLDHRDVIIISRGGCFPALVFIIFVIGYSVLGVIFL